MERTGGWAIPPRIRETFTAALLFGLAAHLYGFTNKLPNHDDLNQMFYADYGTASGRWLLPAVLGLDGDCSVPWLIGLTGLVCLAGTACLTVSLLGIRSRPGRLVTAALLTTFPGVAATFGYMFSADGYFFSLLLAALAAWTALRLGRWGSLAALVCLTLSLGIYQAYLPVTAALMTGAFLLEALEDRTPLPALGRKGLRLILTLGASVALYLLVVRLTTRHTGLTDYEGIAEMGRVSLRELPGLMGQSYGKYAAFFWRNDWGCHFDLLGPLFLLSALGTLVLLGLRLRPLARGRQALVLGLAAIYPLTGTLIYVMVPRGYVHIHMLYGMVYLLLLPVALAEDGAERRNAGFPVLIRRGVSGLLLVTLSLTAWSYLVTDNNAYLKADLGLRQCAAYSNRLLARVEACEGYEPGMGVVLVGSETREAGLDPTPELEEARLVGIFNMGDLRTQFTYSVFLRAYLGFAGPVFTGDSETARAYAATAAVRAMPLYPRAGSVRVLDGAVVVVKLNEK